MSIWRRGPDRIPDNIAAVNKHIHTALVSLWNRVQGPQQKRTTVVALGASPATYTNAFPYPVDVNVTGYLTTINSVALVLTDYTGTAVTATVYNNPVATANTCSGLVLLHPGDAVTVNYTGPAPVFHVIER